MMMLPPFFSFNPYYQRGYSKPYNAYAPREFHTHSSSMGVPMTETRTNNSYIPNSKNCNIPNHSVLNNGSIEKKHIISSKSNFNNSTNSNEYSRNYFPNSSSKAENIKDEYSPFFSIFGIDLYFDDILILALLLFLNMEDVKDSYLYIVLIILLFN